MHGDDSILNQKHGKVVVILSIPQSLHLWFVNLRRPDVFSWVEEAQKDTVLSKIDVYFMCISIDQSWYADGLITHIWNL